VFLVVLALLLLIFMQIISINIADVRTCDAGGTGPDIWCVDTTSLTNMQHLLGKTTPTSVDCETRWRSHGICERSAIANEALRSITTK
jgi:hypothetical protein